MDPDAVLALCHAHAEAEAAFDIERVLDTLVIEPRYEFLPLLLALTGRPVVERFYRQAYPRLAAQVVGYELLGEWSNESAALQEYRIGVRGDEGRTVPYRVMSMMPVDEDTGLLTGERLYCDDGFVRALLGPVYDELSPLNPAD